jgi:imidazolonepropionase-like amidohydrolase
LLVHAGLTPLQALHAATGAAGGILGQPDLGVLRASAVADLLIVAGNPAEDIKATRDIRSVIQAGKVLEELVIEQSAE